MVRNQLLQAEVHIGNGDYVSAESIMNSIRTAAGVAEYTATDARNAVDRAIWPDHLIPERLLDEDHLSERGRDEILKILEEKSFDAVLIGPGLGRVEETTDVTREIIQKFRYQVGIFLFGRT